jgi:hypothetical protein
VHFFRIVYRIALPAGQDADAFEEFMRDRYLPAVHRGPTRIGQIVGLSLWREVSGFHESTSPFLLHVDFVGAAAGGVRMNDEEVTKEFEAFGAALEHLGAYREVDTTDVAAEPPTAS